MSQPQGKKTPKFGSFKSKAKTQPPGASIKGGEGQPGKSVGRKKRQLEGQATKPESSPNPVQAQDPALSKTQRKKQRKRLREALKINGPEDSDLFFVDLHGDPKNVEYGSMDRSKVPDYRRFGDGYVLGSSPLARIDTQLSTDKKIVFVTPSNSKQNQKFLSSKKGNVANTTAQNISPQQGGSDVEEDFCSFDSEDDIVTEVGPGIWGFIECGVEPD